MQRLSLSHGHSKDKMEHLDDRSRELFLRYRAISSKLKKRFFKKPNYREASAEFGKMASLFRSEENPKYAALCYSAMAKCDKMCGDASGESEAWASAGRQFLEAEDILFSARHASYWESLEAGTHCFIMAIQAQENAKHNVMAASYCLEIAHKLKYFEKFHQALGFFQQASELQMKLPECRLQTLSKVASCKIRLREYDGALAVFAKIAAESRGKKGPFALICKSCEESQLLLLLMLQIPRRNLRGEHVAVLEKYSKYILDTNVLTPDVDADKYILFQSLILAVERKSFEEIEVIQPQLWKLLEPEQQHLFKLLMEAHSTKQTQIL